MCDYEDKKGKDIFTKIYITNKCEQLEEFNDIHIDERNKIILSNKILLGLSISTAIIIVPVYIFSNLAIRKKNNNFIQILNKIFLLILYILFIITPITFICLITLVYNKIFLKDKLKFYEDIKKHEDLCKLTSEILLGPIIICGLILLYILGFVVFGIIYLFTNHNKYKGPSKITYNNNRTMKYNY